MPASIKVEHVEFDIGADGSTKALTTDVGDLDKAFFRNNTVRAMSARPVGTNATSNIDEFCVGLQLTATDTITGYRQSGNSGLMRVRGEVWRYEGPPGGPNEFITRARGRTGTFTTLSKVIDLSSAGIVNPDKCVVLINGALLNMTGTVQLHRGVGAGWINAGGDLEIERGEATSNPEFFYEVVEFTGSNWSVGHGKGTNLTDGVNNITLKQGHNFDGADFDVGDWANAIILSARERGAGSGNNYSCEDTMFVAKAGATTTQFIAEFASGAGLPGAYVIAHVVKHADLSVQRGSGVGTIAEGETIYTVSGLTALDEAAIEWSTFSGSGSSNFNQGAATANLKSLTEIQGWVHKAATVDPAWAWAAVNLSGITDDAPAGAPRVRVAVIG